jgi:alpha-amylase
MKNLFVCLKAYALIIVFILSSQSTVKAQNPWNGKVVLQGFWWDYYNNNYPNGWSNYLADLAPRLRDMGVDAIWIPPCIKNAGPNSNGYGPFDNYDLGDKYQKGNLKTRLGNKDELLRMIAVMHANGIEVIQDIVLNHMSDAGSSNGSGGQDNNATASLTNSGYKNFRYASYAKPVVDESASDYLTRSGRWSKNWTNFYPNQFNAYGTNDWNSILFGPDISYESNAYGGSANATYNPTQFADYMRTGARNWMVWFKKQTGSDGFRFDASKHYPYWALQDFIYNVKYNAGWANGGANMFSVGEYIGSSGQMDTWINNVRTSNGGTEDLVGTFDFNLRTGIKNMIDGNGGFDIGSIPNYQQTNRFRTVPFVNNHDTYRPIKDASGNYIGWDNGNEIGGHIDAFDTRLSAAYAVMFAVDGSPQVFFEDLFNIGGTGKRYTHLPTSTTDLPVRNDISNIMWCHQKLNFKKGSYKVRWQAQDLLIIERGYKSGPENSYAIIGVNDNFNTWQTATIQTDFGPNKQLHDYSGANANDIITDATGKATISVPPCNGTNVRKGYCIWGPVGVTGGFAQPQKPTTQEWEMANDLGDSHPNSLQQGGALPASSTALRTVGKVFDEAGKLITVNLTPTNTTKNITVNIYNKSNAIVATKSGVGNLSLTYTPTTTGFYTIKIKNTSATNPSQTAFVKLTYTAPKVANTSTFPSAAAPNAIIGNITDEKVERNLSLSAAYPNPFNQSTLIAYTIKEKTWVQLNIYNAAGQKINTLLSKEIEPGEYNEYLDGATLKNGTYIVELKTIKASQQIKIVVAK